MQSTESEPLPKCKKFKTHVSNKSILVTEDHFGTIYDEFGSSHHVKRFTWKNNNKIRIQLITYGARITSMCLPGRDGVIEDVVLGFEDIAGYLYYEQYGFGATIGRVANRIENATFEIDGKQYWLTPNDGKHHLNGGCKGFDKINWKSYVDKTKVILTHVSRDHDQGYPGDLFVRITYELTPKNEFKVNIEATTSKPTIANLSNLIYVNLAGHYTGPQELYKHIVTINANCYTKIRDDGLPNGKIMNVIYTKNDFMRPTLLKDLIGIEDQDGYNQNFCINRAVDQDLCFVGRILHTPSGRIMEIYSDQYGVNFSTANHLGTGLIDIMQPYLNSALKFVSSDLNPFDLINKLHEKMISNFELDRQDSYSELKRLIRNLYKQSINYKDFTESKERNVDITLHEPSREDLGEEEMEIEEDDQNQKYRNIKLTVMQREYLELMQSLSIHSQTNYEDIKDTIGKMLLFADHLYNEGNGLKIKNDSKVSFKLEDVEKEDVEEEQSESGLDAISVKKKAKERKRKGLINVQNIIPSYYMDGRIHGKNNVIYKRHCALALQTQNYPNAIYHKNFPNCILRPGETYKHTIVYKFWIQGGDPSTWVRCYGKRIKKEEAQKA